MFHSLLGTTQNTRDLGGYIKRDGEQTRYDIILRSDVQNYPSEEDFEYLKSKNIITIIDMRGQKEVDRKPSGFAGRSDFEYHNLQISEGSDVPESVEAVPISYMSIAKAKTMPEVFKCIAKAKTGVMFNCTAGKDRTGVVAAILLLHAGVSDKDIIDNYVLTKEYGRDRLELVHKNFPELDMNIVTPCEMFMEEFLGMFRAEYGDSDHILEVLDLAKVKSRYYGISCREQVNIMATWVTHLMVADEVLRQVPFLSGHEFYVGNIAPDCNVENEDWTSFTPSREVTHWMRNDRKVASDCDRFLNEYVKTKENLDVKEESFLLGYYAHLITDAEFQRFIRDENRVRASWDRIKQHQELSQQAVGMEETWDSVKKLINGRERMKDMYFMEAEYLEKHPESGYITDIIGLEEFPDYIDYLPEGAIVRKVKVMGYMPEKEISQYPYIGMSKEEYSYFVKKATELVVDAIKRYKEKSS